MDYSISLYLIPRVTGAEQGLAPRVDPMRRPDQTTPVLTPADEARFWANIDRLGDHWWWIGRYDGRYPRLRLEAGVYAPAGVIALQLAGEPLAEGRRVRYLCLGGQCVNPEHLGTYSKRAGPWNHTGKRRNS